eukprot:GHVT01025942.1.p1 GENE.GHVT01025942.1~~GHVT01025942.1.p1  ORF type:complete len:177 (+),score=15.93 GHVT01025942.1:114-644(+)
MNFEVAFAICLLLLVAQGGAGRCGLAKAQEDDPTHTPCAEEQVHADLPQTEPGESYNDTNLLRLAFLPQTNQVKPYDNTSALKTIGYSNQSTVKFHTDFRTSIFFNIASKYQKPKNDSLGRKILKTQVLKAYYIHFFCGVGLWGTIENLMTNPLIPTSCISINLRNYASGWPSREI